MKHFKTIIFADFRIFIAVVALCVVALLYPAKARANQDLVVDNPDSIHISLLTCGPHNEIYALYGHTALRYEDRSKDIDIAINYGAFSFATRFFALKFMFGLTDYEMGLMSFGEFCYQYNYFGSSITQQEFNLTQADKIRITKALYENAKPENVVYRYNYYYDNCTTRARDIVCNNLYGKVMFTDTVPEGLTHRKMIHAMNEGHPWARLGNDLLLGVGTDREVTEEEMQFLPHTLHDAANNAYIIDEQGHKRPLILQETQILTQRTAAAEKEFPLSPTAVAVIILILSVVMTVAERVMKRYFWQYDLLLFILQSACGIILMAMIFSQHPTVKLNIQLLILSPLPLFFGYVGRRNYWFWMSGVLMICFALVLNAMGIQWLDPAVRLLALSLLLRYTMRMMTLKAPNGRVIHSKS